MTIVNDPGRRRWIYVYLSQFDGGAEAHQGDYFTTYAGPVYVSARNECVYWSAQIEDMGVAGNDHHCG